MNKEVKVTRLAYASLIAFGFSLIFSAVVIGMRHMEHVRNTMLICDKVGLEYSVKTNFAGNITRIYVKEGSR